mgnify:CR=1 FL=1
MYSNDPEDYFDEDAYVESQWIKECEQDNDNWDYENCKCKLNTLVK